MAERIPLPNHPVSSLPLAAISKIKRGSGQKWGLYFEYIPCGNPVPSCGKQNSNLLKAWFRTNDMRFDEEKAAQVAAQFLRLRGGRMSYLKLMKMLYMAERASLIRWGYPITGDSFYSMRRGPVLSRVLSLIRNYNPETTWGRYISESDSNYEVSLRQDDPPVGRLSIAEERLIGEIFAEFGRHTRWDIVELTHTFPEWRNPGDSRFPITIPEILAAGHIPEEDIAAITTEIDAMMGSFSR
jgi:uncharacterized phage-associated protein